MKKFLSMVLALVMAMSLVTISAGAADFTDADSIDYAEAVEVMTAVGVVDGYADGSFGPDGYLTRGAAAKIICNLILGPTTAEALVADAAPYSDVPTSNVFAGYIAYCQKEGIISGYADGTFRPGNSLTGYAFMKMLLGALGYNAEQEGYTGNNWSINVAKQAINIGLEDGLEGDFVGVNTVTRQEALLYALNTMEATMVEYPNNSTIKVGDITVSTNSVASDVEVSDQIAGYNGVKDGKQQFCEKYFSKLSSSVAEDIYGRPATKWTWKSEKVGTYADKADATYTNQAKLYTVRQDLGLSASETPAFTYAIQGVYSYTYNGVDYPSADMRNNVATTMIYQPSSAGYYLNDIMAGPYGQNDYYPSYNGVTTEVFYDKDNAAYNKIVTIDEMYAKVASVKTDDDGRYITLSGAGVPAGAKFYTDEFAKNDKVVYTLGVNAEHLIASVEAAESVTGTIGYINGSTYVVIDGAGYYMHGINWIGSPNAADTAHFNKYEDISAGDEVIAYLDSNGYILHVEATEANTNLDGLVVIDAVGSVDALTGSKKAVAVYGDGTEEIVTLHDNATAKWTVTNYVMSNGKLKVRATPGYTSYAYPDTTDATGSYSFTKGSTAITGTSIKVDSSTNFVYVDSDGNKTYTGYKNAPTFTGAEKVVALVKDSKTAALLVYVWVDNATITNSSDEFLLAIGDTYYKWSATDENGDLLEYYAIRTLNGANIQIDAAATLNGSGNLYSSIYGNRGVGALVIDSVNYNAETGFIDDATQATANTEYNNFYASGYDIVVKVENDVLYITYVDAATGVPGYSYSKVYTEDAAAYVVAYNGDSFVEEDIATLDGTYMGVTVTYNDDGEVTNIALREKNA